MDEGGRLEAPTTLLASPLVDAIMQSSILEHTVDPRET